MRIQLAVVGRKLCMNLMDSPRLQFVISGRAEKSSDAFLTIVDGEVISALSSRSSKTHKQSYNVFLIEVRPRLQLEHKHQQHRKYYKVINQSKTFCFTVTSIALEIFRFTQEAKNSTFLFSASQHELSLAELLLPLSHKLCCLPIFIYGDGKFSHLKNWVTQDE